MKDKDKGEEKEKKYKKMYMFNLYAVPAVANPGLLIPKSISSLYSSALPGALR